MTEKMTRETATTFDRKSTAHETILAMAANANGCNCQAYVDWFTLRRWNAQGHRIQKGEHGIRLTTWIPVTKIDEDGKKTVTGKRPKGYSVFCRCQTKPIG